MAKSEGNGWAVFLLLIVALSSTVGVMITYLYFFPSSISNDHSRWAEFGTFIGGTLGPIFAFLAFVVLLITLWVNQKELTLTRKVLSSQNSLIEQQSFESTLMQLLKEVEVRTNNIKSQKFNPHLNLTGLANDITLSIISYSDKRMEMMERITDTIEREGTGRLLDYLNYLRITAKFLQDRTTSPDLRTLYTELFVIKLNDDILRILIGYLVASDTVSSGDNLAKELQLNSYLEDPDDVEIFSKLISLL